MQAQPSEVVARTEGEHTVKFSIKVDYEVEWKPIVPEKASSALPKGKKAPGKAKKDDDFRQFFLTYNIGSICEGKSPVLMPDMNQWTASHDVEVNTALLTNMLESSVDIHLYENIKVEVQKQVELTSKELLGDISVNLADTGLTRREILRRAKINRQNMEAVAQQNKAQEGIARSIGTIDAANSKEKVEPSTTKAEQNNANITAAAKRPQSPKQVKIFVEKNEMKILARSNSERFRRPQSTSDSDDGFEKDFPHPHHYDMRSHSGSARRRSLGSAGSVTDMKGRRTPPSPHHDSTVMRSFQKPGASQKDSSDPTLKTHDHEIKSTEGAAGKGKRGDRVAFLEEGQPVRARSETNMVESTSNEIVTTKKSKKEANHISLTHRALLDLDMERAVKKKKPGKNAKSKTKTVIEIQKVLIASFTVALTDFFLGKLEIFPRPVEKKLSGGLLFVEPVIVLDETLLSPIQEDILNPFCISILECREMPRIPYDYAKLDTICQDTFVRFSMFDLSPKYYDTKSHNPRGSVALFNKNHVIFAAGFDQNKLYERFTSCPFKFEIHDRDLKATDITKISAELAESSVKSLDTGSPFGVAQFDVSPMPGGELELVSRTSILPGPRTLMSKIPPGLWVESNSTIKVRFQLRRKLSLVPLIGIQLPALIPEPNTVQRAILICENNWNDVPLTQVLRTDQRVNGVLFFDKSVRIAFLEGKRMDLAYTFETLSSCNNVKARWIRSISTLDDGFELQPIKTIEMTPSLTLSVQQAKTFVQKKTPTIVCHFLTALSLSISTDVSMDKLMRDMWPTPALLALFLKSAGVDSDQFWHDPSTAESGLVESISVPATKPEAFIPMKRVDARNFEFEKWLKSRAHQPHNMVQAYRDKYPYVALPRERGKEDHSVYNYSIQKKSVAALRLAELQAAVKKDTAYLYSNFFDLSLP